MTLEQVSAAPCDGCDMTMGGRLKNSLKWILFKEVLRKPPVELALLAIEIGDEKKLLTIFPRILKKPDILCSDPFNHGWIYRVKPSFETSFLSASDRLANHALEWQKEERERLAAFIQEEPEYKEKLEHQLNEGTLGLKRLLDNMNKLSWHRFEENFLR